MGNPGVPWSVEADFSVVRGCPQKHLSEPLDCVSLLVPMEAWFPTAPEARDRATTILRGFAAFGCQQDFDLAYNGIS